MPAKQLLFLDFDRTLFDLEHFYRTVWLTLGRLYGFDGAAAFGSIRDYYYAPHNGYHGTYNFQRHIDGYVPGLKQKEAKERLKYELQGARFVYDDVEVIYEWQRKYDMRILSFGERRIQEFKFAFCPELKGLPKDFILVPKPQFIAERYPGRSGFLIDDKLEHGLPASIRQLLIRRVGSIENKLESDIIVITSLKEATQYL